MKLNVFITHSTSNIPRCSELVEAFPMLPFSLFSYKSATADTCSVVLTFSQTECLYNLTIPCCSELEEALLVLPFSYVITLLQLLHEFISHGWETELNCRCLFFTLRSVHGLSCDYIILIIIFRNRLTLPRA